VYGWFIGYARVSILFSVVIVTLPTEREGYCLQSGLTRVTAKIITVHAEKRQLCYVTRIRVWVRVNHHPSLSSPSGRARF